MASDNSFSKCAACTRRGQPCSHSQSSLRAWASVVEGQEQLDRQIKAAEQRLEDSFAQHKDSLAVPADSASFMGPTPGSAPFSDPSLELDQILSSFSPPNLTFSGGSRTPGPFPDN
jgi:hypothetical protein